MIAFYIQLLIIFVISSIFTIIMIYFYSLSHIISLF